MNRQQQAVLEKKAESRAKLAIAGVILIGVGLIYGVVVLLGHLQSQPAADPYALPPEVVARDNARREQLKKEREEEQKEQDDVRKKMIADLAAIFRADDKVATELMREFEGVREDHHALTADADPNNDPKDVSAFYIKRLGERAEANNILKNWLGGKAGSSIGEYLWGKAAEARRAKGSTPDFLLAGSYSGSGTGFFISQDGWLVTNQHVVKDRSEVDIRGADGTITKARVVKADAEMDLALVKSEMTPPAALGVRSGELSLGALVFTIGFPNTRVQGVEAKFTEGSISSLKGYRDDPNDYQISVPIQHGNSGGALVEATTGLVSGIVASGLDKTVAENVSYAIKSSQLAKLIAAVPEANTIPAPTASANAGDRAVFIDRAKRATVLVLVH